MIKTREVVLTPDQIRCIRVMPDEVLLVQAEVGTMPRQSATDLLEAIHAHVAALLPPDTKILVCAKDVSFSTIKTS